MSAYRFKKRLITFFKARNVIRFMRLGYKLFILVFIMDTGYLIGIWPDWDLYKKGPIQHSNFIRHYVFEQYRHKSWPDLKWQQKSIQKIPRHMIRALVVAEDARFYSHSGIDVDSIQAAMEYNLSQQRFVYGGSTISQQTVKNIFLSASKNPLRKWHELVLTVGMEQNLTKRRILELYLNVAEFGRGVFGVEAAARHYWGLSASRLSVQQAIALAATLPAPVNHNPSTNTRFFKKQVSKISRYF